MTNTNTNTKTKPINAKPKPVAAAPAPVVIAPEPEPAAAAVVVEPEPIAVVAEPVAVTKTANTFSIFDNKGAVRSLDSAADKAAISSLSPEHKEKLFAVIEAYTNFADAQTRLDLARETANAKIAEHNSCDMAYQGIRPWRDTQTGHPITGRQAEPNYDLAKQHVARTAAAKAVQAAQRPNYKPAPVEVDPLKIKLDEAAAALSAGYLEVREATKANDIASRAYGAAVNAWRLTLQISFDSNVKGHLAAMVEQRAARVAKGLTPEFEPVVKVPEYQTEFDRERSSRGVNKRKPRPLIAR
jgi:hypothetical protein